MLWSRARRRRSSRPQPVQPDAAGTPPNLDLIYTNRADEVIPRAEWEILVPEGKLWVLESTVNGACAVVTMWDGVRTVEGHGDAYWIEQVGFRACSRSWSPPRLLTRAQAKQAHDAAVRNLDFLLTAISALASGDHGLDLSR